MMKINHSGVLYVVATPIGNLKDITLRAIETLKNVSCIAAEDTRHSKQLLQHLAITTPLISLHEHNEEQRAVQLINRLLSGESIALISDAGTPLISDPGYILVKQVKNADIPVVTIPGACALIAALSVSGLPTDRFVFEGFLPSKPKLRIEKIESLMCETRTIIFYESPHRIIESLQAMQQVLGSSREIVVARELTKLFETIKSGSISEVIDWMSQDVNQQKGEFVVLLSGAEPVLSTSNVLNDKILNNLLAVMSVKQATELTSKITGSNKNIIYKQALKIKNSPV